MTSQPDYDINKILEEGMVEDIEFIDLSVDPAWRAPMPRLEGQEIELVRVDEAPVKPKFKCKHPSSFLEWQAEGRWCDKCKTMIAGPR